MNRYHISVFSKEANSGNPCIVYLSRESIAPSVMQMIAAAEAVSETAFICADGDALRLKIFSPVCEMFSCLHATIAACYVLKLEKMASGFYFGDSLVSFCSEDDNILLQVTQIETAKLQNVIDLRLRQHFASAIGLWCVTTASGKLRLMVQLSTEQAVTDICAEAIGEVAQSLSDVESFFIYALCSAEGGYVGRMFAPRLGIVEDPVNGNSCIALFSILRANNTCVTALSVRQGKACSVNLILNDEGMFVIADCILITKSVIT
ncbi:PhzF family phenazine biosynthesis protein [Alteromonas sp. CYL-A6]|uniref:PhzF family phenazine biosynthesis protein n=1 Tax=Alteromonas nitratireducens TaxID=3390813 RepID=UPI0034B1174A